MKIGILYGGENTPDSDMRTPELGNPGVGGTQYCVGMLIRYLSMNSEFSIRVYQYGNTIFPDNIDIRKIKSLEEMAGFQKDEDIFVAANFLKISDYNIVNCFETPVVLWVHNHLRVEEAKIIADSKVIKRVVFVGRQLYDLYIDHQICGKATYIFNMFKSDVKEYNRKEDFGKNVTYMGRLAGTKGFHILAEQWKNILEKVPEAQLYVMGNGDLYGKEFKLGKYGLADEAYERKFMQFLTDSQGEILPSVHFCGILGQEKYEIFNMTSVGVVNPSAMTETFGLSAVEMEACGIPIVTKGEQGLLDTVLHRKTGLLYRNEKNLGKNVCKLLLDEELNKKLGGQAQSFVRNEFAPERLIESWVALLYDVFEGTEVEYKKPVNFLFKQNKWLRILNRRLQKICGIQLSLMELKDRVMNEKRN